MGRGEHSRGRKREEEARTGSQENELLNGGPGRRDGVSVNPTSFNV